ncbi:acyl-CoA dehydrogenase [Aldersonia sp. NBC_00410]|uniref:acyl-CoA dehydrogenase n=1 Tax=Aldersonia sp. NBC_00410 TaxID=2975954 RepID=UPI002250D37D|nr:acyl-CoA dehydrogenase [Aldersonia sp. NBC_00410]MCX5043270.1 acyl-CoA dehydrogenase [Aldersonia sp. NBC_00410]
MTTATTDEQKAVQQSIRAWARSAHPIATQRDGGVDSWQALWPGLAGLGLFSVALPEVSGGVDGTVLDLAVMIEESARNLVGGPVLGTALAGLLVGRHEAGESAAAQRFGPEISDGKLACAVALSADPVPGHADDSGVSVSGDAGLVLGATDSTAVLLPVLVDDTTVWCLVDAGAPGLILTAVQGLDHGVPLARVSLAEVHVDADRVLTGLDADVPRNLAVALAAAEAAGIAGWCLETAVEYAKVREQFGKKIGSFQAVKHICAQMLTRVERIRAVAWDAAVAAEEALDPAAKGGGDLPIAAAVAGAVALDDAVETAKDCIQVLGGIGFTWEHDAHLYLRRAGTLRQLLGGGPKWRARVVELTRAGARRGSNIDLSEYTDLRDEIVAEAEKIAALPADERRVPLAESGLLAAHWPKPYGRAADAAEQLLIAEELDRVGVARPDLIIGWWAVPTILEHGTPEQIERFAMPTLRGELNWCQLFSEPGAGSDLAALRTSATKVEGGWKLQGQKVWTSKAQESDWGICLARTNPDAPKHRGISYFVVDMRSPGVDIRPLLEIIGEPRFNEVFLDDVFVPDDCLVGTIDDGWKLANTTLANERVAIGGGSLLDKSIEELVEATPVDDAVANDKLGSLIANSIVGSLLDLRTAIRSLEGQDPGPESSVRKLLGVQQRQGIAEFAFEVAGVEGVLDDGPAREFLVTRCLSIAGGTTQILLTVAAERILGLPRG